MIGSTGAVLGRRDLSADFIMENVVAVKHNGMMNMTQVTFQTQQPGIDWIVTIQNTPTALRQEDQWDANLSTLTAFLHMRSLGATQTCKLASRAIYFMQLRMHSRTLKKKTWINSLGLEPKLSVFDAHENH